MSSIAELRERLQGPRKAWDTFYGRQVMRRLSIYITAMLIPLPVHPVAVSLVSIAIGLAGAWRLAGADWVVGIMLVNGWYLLDHVDGELARYRGIRCATGLFMDTIANPVVFPATFFAVGLGLWRQGGDVFWLFTGVWAAYGSLMLSVVPFCESMVALQRFKQGRLAIPLGDNESKSNQTTRSPARRFFSFIQWIKYSLEVVLLIYACIANGVWVAITANTVITQKIDRNYPSIEKAVP